MSDLDKGDLRLAAAAIGLGMCVLLVGIYGLYQMIRSLPVAP